MKIDYREKKIINDFPQAEVCNLEIGDIIEGQLCIERKTIGDFLSSIIDRRLFNQSIQMKENFKFPIILVEGDLRNISEHIYFTHKKISIENVRGAIASIYVKYNVPILFCSTKNNFIELVNLLIEKSKEECNGIIIEPPISKTKANPKLQVLLQVSKIGLSKAKKILDHYGNFENLKIMDRPKGVSETDIKNILEVLR
jgi:ERCC4-type nuclease